jgi:hypothetical protein
VVDKDLPCAMSLICSNSFAVTKVTTRWLRETSGGIGGRPRLFVIALSIELIAYINS